MKLLWAQIFFRLFCLAEFRRGLKRQGRGGGRTENGKKKKTGRGRIFLLLKERQRGGSFSDCAATNGLTVTQV